MKISCLKAKAMVGGQRAVPGWDMHVVATDALALETGAGVLEIGAGQPGTGMVLETSSGSGPLWRAHGRLPSGGGHL